MSTDSDTPSKMTRKNLFAKVGPNIKLNTRASEVDGREIEVEIREDEEIHETQKAIIELLIAAGYFRARVKGLSDFDKIVGGMSWCIESCDFEVDVDLLFNENLTIGQKITLTEKIVAVLIEMKCPYKIEPHQIQGLDYINLFPLIQWLVKKSVQNRTEKSDRLKSFSEIQFKNHFELESEKKLQEKREQMIQFSKSIDENFLPTRHFKKIGNEIMDEKKRVNLTLMEYMDRNLLKASWTAAKAGSSGSADQKHLDFSLDSLQPQERDQELYDVELNDEERDEVLQHYKSLKFELEDTQGLSKQNKLNNLRAASKALKIRLERLENENQVLKNNNEQEIETTFKAVTAKKESLEEKIKELNEKLRQDEGKSFARIQELIIQNEKLSKEESKFKENCKKQLREMQEKIENYKPPEDTDITEYTEKLEEYNQIFKQSRIQLAKKNRQVLSVQRQLDNIPDNTELGQYQRRFVELYNQISVKHKETKQFFALYNTLNDIKMFLEKEISILNNICESYEQGRTSSMSRTQYMEELAESLNSNKSKLKKKYDEEKKIRDDFNSQLLGINEDQRKYAVTVKQFRKMCQRHEVLSKYLQSVEAAE